MSDDSDRIPLRAPISLLRTKLHRPPVTADFVPRPHLIQQLSTQRDRPLILVSAPAGSGKTTLLSAWLAQEDRPSAWLSLDAHDNDLATFVSYLLAAVQTVFPEAGRATQALVNAPHLPPLSVLANSLINELDELDEPFILVIEDYHVMTDPAIDDFLVEVLNHPPRPLRLVVAARHDPSFALDLLRARGQVTEIRSQNLRFSLEETGAFLRQALGANVDAATVAALKEKTEGWIAGLRLAALALHLQGQDQTHLESLLTHGRLVMDYLASEVLAHQPPAIQEFLLKTSVLERLSGSLCDTVISLAQGSERSERSDPYRDSQAHLEWLEKSDLFIVALDEHRQWYRYHHLFQELLQQQLASRCSRDEIAELHRRASAWFAAHDQVEEAFHHAFAAGDIAAAVQLVERYRQALINEDQYPHLERWLRLFPREVIEESPELLLAQAWNAWNRFQVAEVIALVDRAEPLVTRMALEPAAANRANRLQGEVETLRSYQYSWTGDPARAIDHAERALQETPSASWNARAIARMFLAGGYLTMGDLKRAYAVLDEGLSEAQTNDAFQMRVLVIVCILHWINADLQSVMNAASQVLALRELQNRPQVSQSTAYAHFFMGMVHYQRNELAQAEQHLSAALEQRYAAHILILTQNSLVLALTYQAQNQPDKAREVADLLPAILAERGNPLMLPAAQALQAELALRQGRLDQAGQWTARVQPGALVPLPLLGLPLTTLLKVLLAQNTSDARQTAAAALERLRDSAEGTHRTHSLIEVLALQALLHNAEGDQSAALSVLERAVLLAQPGGFIRVFADLGPGIAELLKRLARRNIARPYIEQILAALSPSKPVAAPVTQAAMIEPLTERELQVLALLQQGLSNKEIAARLVISLPTAKRHIINIYQKLLVSNRREAVAKASAIGLLPPP
jgi:LuxR family maltose regulon positive regulatory protein